MRKRLNESTGRVSQSTQSREIFRQRKCDYTLKELLHRWVNYSDHARVPQNQPITGLGFIERVVSGRFSRARVSHAPLEIIRIRSLLLADAQPFFL